MTLLNISDLKAYYGKTQILRSISIEINEEETVALVGRNGAGKSTTLKSIIGLVSRKGKIQFKNERIENKKPWEIASRGIGYVPETRRVIPQFTVEDNINIFMKEDSEWSLERVFKLFPPLEERKNAKAGALSGGEQQMLAIARTIVTNSELLLLDEAFEGLAPVIRGDLKKFIKEIKKTGTTLLLTEQSPKVLEDIVDKVYIIEKGQIKWKGSISRLKKEEEKARRYLTLEGG